MSNEISYKSYCWVVGTTSYRTDNFNHNIEKQLELLDEFWQKEENTGIRWTGNSELQKRYYDFLKEKAFITGEAERPDKDAREKTSGLVDIGLLDSDRHLTEAGKELLGIALSNDFAADNPLELPRDSFVYFKQMLKTCNRIDKNVVRPFLVFLYVVYRTKYLTNAEFTYLLPLCVNPEITEYIISEILSSRTGSLDYEKIILDVLMGMPNYQKALQMLQTETITEDLICTIGFNRKSKRYDKPYFKIYNLLKNIVFHNENSALELLEATKKLTNSKIGSAWRKYFFRNTSRRVVIREGNGIFHAVPILKSRTEEEFNKYFFEIMHLIKAKATLSDYFDLNRRYFKATDTVIFQDDNVSLDILPKCYVEDIADKLMDIAFEETDLLEKNAELCRISPYLKINKTILYQKLGRIVGTDVKDTDSARKIIRDERYARWNRLIDEKFPKEALIRLFTYFEERNDSEIRAMVTDNADIPTIFEYVLGIAWYLLSERKGDVLEYMNLSLEADLLPKTHAGGGEADIVWEYDETGWYPKHTLLIEATLADGSNQRRMEMEPVSRHLGEHCLSHPEEEAYCVFVTTYLNTNVISDFRARRHMEYYNSDGTEYITGMKILPIQTSELRSLLKSGVEYPQIYQMLDKAYNSSGTPKEWYEKNIVIEAGDYKC
ncbi:MAG: AlwI family type II restriction endonuclease [Lachnospiraceae bacterium]|nr:AlwI family type II restriction endonuclease [Lachnospiraceae bacterium]